MESDEQRRIVDACRQFEILWRSGKKPSIEDIVSGFPVSIGQTLREELDHVRLELEANFPAVENYERLGDFRILREIGRGGMACVYEAVQESLGRHVALKVLMLPSTDKEGIQRFHQEARMAASLHHSHIVAVYGVGEDDGVHYMAMELIRGCGLERIFRESNGSGEPALIGQLGNREHANRHREIARIGLEVAEALKYAHEREVLHRDIKPANLLVDQTGNIWVADFGMATSLREASELTRSGQVLGTLQYVPPEAFEGKWNRRSDLYSLGMTLYRLLTLRHAFDGKDQTALMRQIVQQRPATPRSLDSSVPQDLDTIICKLIEKEPSHRYRNARALADDLQRFLNHEPIEARPLNAAQRFGRWCKREPRLAALSAAVLLALIGGVMSTSWQWRRAEDRATAEAESKDLALASERQHSRELVRFYLNGWHRSGEEGGALESLAWLDKAMELESRAWPEHSPEGIHAVEMHRIRAAATLQQIPTLTQMWFGLPNSWALAPAFLPDGETIATAVDTSVRFYDIATGRELGPRLKMPKQIRWMRVSLNGKLLATGCWGSVQLWSLDDHAPIGEPIPFEPEIIGGSFDDFNQHLVVNGYHGFYLLDCSTGRVKTEWIWTAHTMDVDMEFIPNTSIVTSKHQRWNARTVAAEEDLFQDPNRAYGMAFSDDGELVVTAHSRYLNVWNVSTGERLFDPVPFASSLDFRPWHVDLTEDKRFAAVAGGHGAMIVDAVKGTQTSAPIRHSAHINKIEFSPAGDVLATASSDTTVRLWRVPSGKPLGIAIDHDSPVIHLKFSSNGRQLLTASANGIVRLWDLAGAVDAAQLMLPHICHAAPLPDNARMVASFADKHTRILESRTLQPQGPWISHSHVPRYLSVGANGKRLVVTSGKERDSRVVVWDLETMATQDIEISVDPIGIQVSPQSHHLAYFFDVMLGTYPLEEGLDTRYSNLIFQFRSNGHPSRNGVAFTSDDSRPHIGVKSAIETRSMIEDAPVKSGWIAQATEDVANPLAISPDDSLLAVAPGANVVKIVDAASYKVQSKFQVTGVEALEFSPDSKLLGVASSENYARVFDVGTGIPDSPPMEHGTDVDFITFSPPVNSDSNKGRWIATADNHGNIRFWDSETYQAVTPPLQQGSRVTRLQFFPDGERLMITGADRMLRIWKVPKIEPNTDTDLRRLMRFLSRRSYDDHGELAVLPNDDLSMEWESVRKSHPQWFTVTERQIKAWREQQMTIARSQGNVFAEQFHRLSLSNEVSESNSGNSNP